MAGAKGELMSFSFWVKYVTKSSAVRDEGRGGGIGEEGREHGKQFPGIGGGGVSFRSGRRQICLSGS